MPIPRLACMLPFPGAWLLAFFARCGTVVALWGFWAKTKGRNFWNLRPSRLFLGGDRRT
jgi:hypothetical protein